MLLKIYLKLHYLFIYLFKIHLQINQLLCGFSGFI